MHPPFDTLTPGLTFDPPSSLLGGEALLASVYNAIRNSSSATGSNYLNTTLLVTFDEHGGTYDHVQPPSAVPPHAGAAPGQWGFKFDRSGVRIPTLAVSAWIPERTVVNDEHRATSLIATMRERWNLGSPRETRALAALLLRSSFHCRRRESKRTGRRSWPGPFQKRGRLGCPRWTHLSASWGNRWWPDVWPSAEAWGKKVPAFDRATTITGAQGQAMMDQVLGELFPRLRG